MAEQALRRNESRHQTVSTATGALRLRMATVPLKVASVINEAAIPKRLRRIMVSSIRPDGVIAGDELGFSFRPKPHPERRLER